MRYPRSPQSAPSPAKLVLECRHCGELFAWILKASRSLLENILMDYGKDIDRSLLKQRELYFSIHGEADEHEYNAHLSYEDDLCCHYQIVLAELSRRRERKER